MTTLAINANTTIRGVILKYPNCRTIVGIEPTSPGHEPGNLPLIYIVIGTNKI